MPESIARAAAFIDRDGVINEERGYVHQVRDFRILPGVVEGLRTLQSAGFSLLVVTNQAGIARGLYAENDLATLTAHMRTTLERAGVHLLDVYFCPHHPEARLQVYRCECECRKPRPGMILRAAREHNLDLARSVLVGDKLSDIQAGRAAHLAACVLVASGHAVCEGSIGLADALVPDLRAASSWILHRFSGQDRSPSPPA